VILEYRFNPSTTIVFSLPHKARVSVKIYDLHGRAERILIEEHRPADEHVQAWEDKNEEGTPAVNGIYLPRMPANEFMR